MAEGLLRHLTSGRIEALSAGTRASRVHPRAIRVMGEMGVDLSGHRSKSVEEFSADPPDLVIAVCSRAAESCPAVLDGVPMLRWPFDDPDAASGTEEEILDSFRRVRDEIRAALEDWIAAGLAPLPVG